MTTDEMLKALKERGLDIVLRADGTPAFVGPAKEVTTRLLNAMRWHREEIVRRLTAVKPVGECPACGKGLDAKRRCWALKCGWRKCATCDGRPFYVRPHEPEGPVPPIAADDEEIKF